MTGWQRPDHHDAQHVCPDCGAVLVRRRIPTVSLKLLVRIAEHVTTERHQAARRKP